MRGRSRGWCGGPGANEPSVQADHELPGFLVETLVTSESRDNILAVLVIGGGNRQVAQQAGQGAWFQLKGTLDVRDLRWNRYGSAEFPLGHCGLADPCGLAERTLGEALPDACLLECTPELGLLCRSRQAGCPLARCAVTRSMAYQLGAPCAALTRLPLVLLSLDIALYNGAVTSTLWSLHV